MSAIVKEFHALLNDYLGGKILEDDVRYWIGCHLDDTPEEITPLFHDVTLALWDMEYARAHGHATEDYFRESVAELLAEDPASTPGAE